MKSAIKFLPIIVLGGLIMTGTDAILAAPIATIVAIFLNVILEKNKLSDVMECAMEGAKEAVLPSFVMMLAYALGSIFMATGTGAAAINLFLNLGVNGTTVSVVGFLAAALISTSTGTSWGTFACCLPIFMWLCNIVDGNPGLTYAALAGGAAFGDNIGLISDTTIISSGVQGVKVMDRVRSQFAWSIGCLVLASIAYFTAGKLMGLGTTPGNAKEIFDNISPETIAILQEKRPAVITLLEQVEHGTSVIMLLPALLIIVMAIMKIDTIICITSGIVLSSVMGLLLGYVDSLSTIMDLVYGGFSDAGAWPVVLMLWVMAMGAVMRSMDAFSIIGKLIIRLSRNVRTLISWNGVLCLLGNMALSEDISTISAIGPVIKDVVENEVEGNEEDIYKLKLRNALLNDSIGCHCGTIIPWHATCVYYLGLAAAMYPVYQFTMKDLWMNYMAIISIASLLLLTITGLDRFVPGMAMPSEPAVKLKK